MTGAALVAAMVGLAAFGGCSKKKDSKGPIGIAIPSFSGTTYTTPVAGFATNGATGSYAVVGFFWGNNGTGLLVFTQDDLSGFTHLYARTYTAGGLWGAITRVDDDPTAFATGISVTPSNGSANVWIAWSRNGSVPIGRVYQFVSGWGPIFSNDFAGLTSLVFRQDGTLLILDEIGNRIMGYRLAFGSTLWEFMNSGNPIDLGVAGRDYSVHDFAAAPGAGVVVAYSDDNDNIFVRASADNGATWKTNHAVGGSLSLTTFDGTSDITMFANGDAFVSLEDSTTTNQIFYAFYTTATDTIASASITVSGVNTKANNDLTFPGYGAAARDKGLTFETFTETAVGGVRPYGFSYTHTATGIVFSGEGDLTNATNAGNSVAAVSLAGNEAGVTFLIYRQSDGSVGQRLYGIRYESATDALSTPQLLDGINPTDNVDTAPAPSIVFFPEVRNVAFIQYKKTSGATTHTFAVTPWDATSATPATSVLLADITKTGAETAAILAFIPDAFGRVLINFHESFITTFTDHAGFFGVWDSTTGASVSRQRITRANPVFGVTNPPTFSVDLFVNECTNTPGGTGTSLYRQLEDDGDGFITPMFAEN